LKVSPGQLAVDFSSGKIDIVINLPSGAYSKINSGNDPVNKTGTTVDYVNDLQFDAISTTYPWLKHTLYREMATTCWSPASNSSWS
jgi:flagellin FlaB